MQLDKSLLQTAPDGKLLTTFGDVRFQLLKMAFTAAKFAIYIAIGLCLLLGIMGLLPALIAGSMIALVFFAYLAIRWCEHMLAQQGEAVVFWFLLLILVVGFLMSLLLLSQGFFLGVIGALIGISLVSTKRSLTIILAVSGFILYATFDIIAIATAGLIYSEKLFPDANVSFFFDCILVSMVLVVLSLFISLASKLLRQAITTSAHLQTTSEHLRIAEAQNRQQLSTQLSEQQRLLNIVQKLQVPVIPFRDDMLVVPLVGDLDTERIDAIEEHILRVASAQHSELVVLEMTGVPTIDTQAANQLMRLSESLRLIGVQSVLTGIQPEIAANLAILGVDLQSIRSYATIQDALEQIQ